MNDYEHIYDSGYPALSIGSYTAKVFGWMTLGLLCTFAASCAAILSGFISSMLSAYPAMLFILMIGELALVFFLSARINRLSYRAALALFFAYSVLNGVTLSTIFFAYDTTNTVLVFGLTALFFAVMAIYGFITKADLTAIGRIMSFGLILLIGFWVLSMFLNLSAIETIMCFIGLAIFLGLTAYDTQKIKAYYYSFSGDADMLNRAAVLSALGLYLDFINIFLYVLRILGRRK